MSGPDGIRISGGGSIGVDTAAMPGAMHLLTAAHDELERIAWSTTQLAAPIALDPASAPLLEAVQATRAAAREAEVIATGLRAAAMRYGLTEDTVLARQEQLGATIGATAGELLPVAVLLLGPLLTENLVADAVVGGVGLRTLQESLATGRIAPQADPVLIRALAVYLASMDDITRGEVLAERPEDRVTNDPSGPGGVESISATLGSMLLHPAGGPLSVTATSRTRVTAPGSLAALADRVPNCDHTAGAPTPGQVIIERFDGGNGPHWVVSIAGTVTFDRDSGTEPFDLASDLLGVAHRPSDSERSVLEAMSQAGIGRDEPVLLVGHSQGALLAVRVAQDGGYRVGGVVQFGGYRVGGVVQFGGPTGQIVLPADIPVLAVEHDEDIVPALRGAAAVGTAGLNRLVVRRSDPNLHPAVPLTGTIKNFPAHDIAAYATTTAEAEKTGDFRIVALKRRLAPFLDSGPGTATRYRADRVVSSGPAPTADAG